MTVLESISLAIFNLRANIMRTFLTLLGMIIGVAAVITILTLGHSLSKSVKSSFESQGGTYLQLVVKKAKEVDPLAEQYDVSTTSEFNFDYTPVFDEDNPDSAFTLEDIDILKDRLEGTIDKVAIGTDYYSYSGEVSILNSEDLQQRHPDINKADDVSYTGINAAGFELGSNTISAGRSITEDEVQRAQPVALVSEKWAKKLLGDDAYQLLDREISLETEDGSLDLTVVGFYESKSTSPLTGFETERIYFPYTLQKTINPSFNDQWASLSASLLGGKNPSEVKTEVDKVLADMWRDKPGYTAETLDLSSALKEVNKIIGVLSAVVSAIAGIALLVGGIGVMNVMLITVTERTREIGIRKALGARRRDIRVQFVVEAIIVCLSGGLMGVLIGSIFGYVGSLLIKAPSLPPIGGVLASLFICIGTGLFFGWYPADKAAKLDPIESLRYE